MLHQFEIDRPRRKPTAAANAINIFTQARPSSARIWLGLVQAQKTFLFQIHQYAKDRFAPSAVIRELISLRPRTCRSQLDCAGLDAVPHYLCSRGLVTAGLGFTGLLQCAPGT